MATKITVDGMTAAARAAYALSEAAVIYPITPASRMAETVESWSAAGETNLMGQTVAVKEMQSEKGVAGALHGYLAGGALASTFTASQGLMLMIPNLYKLSGELLPGVLHVTSRSLSAHALSIFGDHQDVMAVRQTGVAMLASASVQECMDLSWVAHLSAIEGSLPFVHFFDGFRTSDEICTIEDVPPEAVAPLVDWGAVQAFRDQALEPQHPRIRGTAQNPDIYFQNREAANPRYDRLPAIVQGYMDGLAKVCGRQYHLFDYVGAPDAEHVVVTLASSCDVAEAAVRSLAAQGRKVGLVKVRLYRPFSAEHLMDAIPATAKVVCALDRTKEPGSLGEPLFLDVCSAVQESGRAIAVLGGRYGLSSKDFTPSMAAAVFDNMAADQPKRRFTVGIDDDVTHLSLPKGPALSTLPDTVRQYVFYGFGSDGTVGASKQAAKIAGEAKGLFAQEYSWFDSKKSGGLTISYLRLADGPVRAPWLIENADYVACNKSVYVKRGYRMADKLKEGGTFVLNAQWTDDELDRQLPPALKAALAKRRARLFVVDAAGLAAKHGLGNRINMIMLAVFFKLTDLMPYGTAVDALKNSVRALYAHEGADAVKRDLDAIDEAAGAVREVRYPDSWASALKEAASPDEGLQGLPPRQNAVLDEAYLKEVFEPMERLEGNRLPVSAMDPAGFVPAGTSAYEKRTVAQDIPRWDPLKCVQCYECSFVCPHAAIRPFVATDEELAHRPEGYDTVPAKLPALAGMSFRIQVYPQDCVGCGSCADNCPAPGKALVMQPLSTQLDEQRRNLEFAQNNVSLKDEVAPADTVPGTQLRQPLLEFSGCCGGCGETPYVKLLTQLFGPRLVIANATGCSSIWGAYMPAMPYTVDKHGCGPAWGNSLFEDNGEYGYGIARGIRVRREGLSLLVDEALADPDGCGVACETAALLREWKGAMGDPERSRAIGEVLRRRLAFDAQTARARSASDAAPLKRVFDGSDYPSALLARADLFAKKSVWCIGGDGWAYDIGFGGLDEVLASKENINVLVLDTEGYSNTGGEMSKATQLGSVSGFTVNGKPTPKKNLGRMMMQYGYVYVAHVCLGADMQQTIDALREAEAYDGPSIVIALCPCISWGIREGMHAAVREQKRAVATGYWPLYRFNPAAPAGTDPLTIDCTVPDKTLPSFLSGQNRFASLAEREPELSALLQSELAKDVVRGHEELVRTVEVYKG
ncbi:pyruvate:ferredoxin (flavodoxin) oxidoreductase [Adlercreutzia aquisgranensis]|uniref:pyruvate:ferredoxin (flavodoxin) oxidoreductase n=1 Tax=Adlercreutzia aquisgranensis TaxID=2941323 RepID=UPI00203A52A1|nr:pyruvate:ferredoxin (flavodoxin) oxidoreductase [Adlercreutzia aquisgranensis]